MYPFQMTAAGVEGAVSTLLAVHFGAQPEDATTLGVREHATRLGTPGESVAEGVAYGAVVRELEGATPSSRDERLDRDAALRVARFFARYHDRDRHAENLELAALPNAALVHGVLHARTEEDYAAVIARAEAVPAFLDAHAQNLRRGAKDGRAPDAEVVRTFTTRILPGAARSATMLAESAKARGAGDAIVVKLASAAQRASDAYTKLARAVSSEIAPRARATAPLGEEEVRFRLKEAMGLERDPASLLAFAKETLANAHAEIARLAEVKTFPEAKAVLWSALAAHPATIEEAVARYAALGKDATRFVRERSLVPVPDDLALEYTPLPPAIADGAGVTNWPAPLLDRRGRGHVLYASDPHAHPLVPMRNLAVHEAIPGHYLQSAVWQRSFDRCIRFLGVADDVAMAYGYFGTMLSVEGWAVHMERLLDREGFSEPGPERLFFQVCEAIRAVRVILDLELHAGGMDDESAARFGADATLMGEGWARSQVLRCKRIPLQSLTYLVGADEIARLQASSKESPLDFHAKLLADGPVPPALTST